MTTTPEEWAEIFREGDIAGTLNKLWGVPYSAAYQVEQVLREKCPTCWGRKYVDGPEYANGWSDEKKKVPCSTCRQSGWRVP